MAGAHRTERVEARTDQSVIETAAQLFERAAAELSLPVVSEDDITIASIAQSARCSKDVARKWILRQVAAGLLRPEPARNERGQRCTRYVPVTSTDVNSTPPSQMGTRSK